MSIDAPSWDYIFKDCEVALEAFARSVRASRRRQRLTQADLASKVGISRTYLSMIEGAKADHLSFRTTHAIINALGGELWIQLD